MKKKVLIATNWYYSGPIQVGSHNIARTFEHLGYDVAFLSAPLSIFHLFFHKIRTNPELNERWKIHFNQGKTDGNIWYYIPFSLITSYNKPILSSAFVINNWHKFCFPKISKTLIQFGFDNVDILWLENPVYHFLMDHINHRHSILRIMDDLKEFDSSSNAFLNKVNILANQVNKVVFSAKNLINRYERIDKNNNDRFYYMPNAVNYDFLINASKKFPDEFSKIQEPRILYIGAIEKWFDVNLLQQVAFELPECNFVLIGPSTIDLQPLLINRNIFYLGPQPYKRIMEFISNSSVGIIPFIRNKLIETVNPIKLFEYMAGGLPVVSTKWKELEYMKSPAYLADSTNEFVSYIRKALQENDRDKYLSYAQLNSWKNRVSEFLNTINF